MTTQHSNAFVAVHSPDTIFVIFERREAFDLIDLPMTDHGPKENGGHVITKAIWDGPQKLIFQYWITKPQVGEAA